MKPLTPEAPSFILASASPRRLELSRRIGFMPVVRRSNIPEEKSADESPEGYARRLAVAKARDVAASVESDMELPGWVLSADTIVVHKGEVLEKPVDRDDACRMLAQMSGEEHTVITAFCWLWRAPGQTAEDRLEVCCDISAKVWFRDLSEEMISRYVATEEPMDKAGSYGIQDIGSTLVRRIEGSYFCIVGLPVCEVVEELEKLDGLREYPFI